MASTSIEYVFKTPEGGWRVAGSRVSLDSVVQEYWAGRSPEAIVEQFPALALEQVYGAIAFYLRNREEVDRHLAATGVTWERLKAESRAANGPLLDRIRASRRPAKEDPSS